LQRDLKNVYKKQRHCPSVIDFSAESQTAKPHTQHLCSAPAGLIVKGALEGLRKNGARPVLGEHRPAVGGTRHK